MHLILMRHAKADEKYTGSDLSRPLTEEGIYTQNKMAQYLKEQSIKIDGILYSPFKRAEDSAEIVHKLYPEAMFVKEPALGTVFDSYTILNDLEKKGFQNALIVGHAPTLSAFALSLMKDPKPIEFDKSGLAYINFGDSLGFGRGDLELFLSPKDLKG